MVLNFDELCHLITNKYSIDYVVINKEYKIIQFSDGVVKFSNNEFSNGIDIRAVFFELIGYERDIEKLLQGEKKSFELKTVSKNNYYIDIYIQLLKDKNGFVIFIEDTTAKIEKERIILHDRNSNDLLLKEIAYKNSLLNRYKKAAENSMPIIYLNSEFKITNINVNFLKLLNYSFEELEKRNFEILIKRDEKYYFNKDNVLFNINRGLVYNEIVPLNEKFGNIIYANTIFVPIFDEKNSVSEILIFAYDITKQKKSNEKLITVATKDKLTNLLNRFGFEEKLNSLVNNSCKSSFVLMFLDLDDFKRVNDEYGDYFGDLLLKKVASRLKNMLRIKDILVRYGGDEFVVILDNSPNKYDTAVVANKIIQKLSSPFLIENREIKIGVSIGAAFFPQDSMHSEELIRKSDKAMYKAKKSGKNLYCFYDEINEG